MPKINNTHHMMHDSLCYTPLQLEPGRWFLGAVIEPELPIDRENMHFLPQTYASKAEAQKHLQQLYEAFVGELMQNIEQEEAHHARTF